MFCPCVSLNPIKAYLRALGAASAATKIWSQIFCRLSLAAEEERGKAEVYDCPWDNIEEHSDAIDCFRILGRSVSHQRNVARIIVDHLQNRVHLLRLQLPNCEERLLVDAVLSACLNQLWILANNCQICIKSLAWITLQNVCYRIVPKNRIWHFVAID